MIFSGPFFLLSFSPLFTSPILKFLFSAKPDGTISELKVLNQIQNTSCAIDYNTSGLYYPSLDYNGFLFPLTLFHSSALWLYLVIQK
ncbi:hypothetical protein RclHR1_04360011 [Rhizophagus clarus]|uniref:Uncharacterized protein n=1 Tax=Rhizophagus clarus TaxID=94130 RepID=A0A2Z6RGQ6_9GLOM|nr:hypothetical protein RclHR1_04360011 [Rhizophagus clarus]